MSDYLFHIFPSALRSQPIPEQPKTALKVSISNLSPLSKPKVAPVQHPISRLIREANSLVHSWRHGLTESEREACLRAEERRQILLARMHNVSPEFLGRVRHPLFMC
jgi:TAG lipase/steryl ester hydrolase/phospholipase A2/LPA acyltransferase